VCGLADRRDYRRRSALPLVYVDDVVDAMLLAAKRDGVWGGPSNWWTT